MAQANNNPNIRVEASLKADIEKYSNMTEQARSAEAQRLVSSLVQTVKQKGILGGIWTSQPVVMAGIKRAAELMKGADVPKDVSEPLAKRMLSTQELFTQKLLPKIEFVLRHYKGGMDDNMVQITETEVNQILTSNTATEQQYADMDRRLSHVQSVAFSIVLVTERLRGQLIAAAIKRFATTPDGIVDQDAKKIMLRRVFNICPETARRIIHLSNLFLVYPRLMFVSATSSTFITLWKPLCKWMEENTEEAAELRGGFQGHQLACGVTLNATESADPDDLPKIDRLQAHDRQYMPELSGFQGHLLQPQAPPQQQQQPQAPPQQQQQQPQYQPPQQQQATPQPEGGKPKPKGKAKKIVIPDDDEEEGTTAFEQNLQNIISGVATVTTK